MEQLILIVIVLLVIFGFGTVQLPIDFDFPHEAETLGNITGNENVRFVETGDINLDFQGHVGGNSRVYIESERGNAYLRFRDQISGTAEVQVRSPRGDVYIGFDKFITRNSRVRIESGGNVIFANDRAEIQGYINDNLLEIRAGGRIYYGDDSFFRRFRSG